MIDSLKDQLIVFTGSLSSMTRKEAINLVRAFKGKTANHVSKETTLLVVGYYAKTLFDTDPQTVKESTAREFQKKGVAIEIINEKAFLKLIQNELAKISHHLQ